MSTSLFVSIAFAVKTSPTKDKTMARNVRMVCLLMTRVWGVPLAIVAHRVQLLFGVGEIGIDLERGLKLYFCLGITSLFGKRFAELIVGHIVVGADGESLLIERDRLLPVGGQLGFLEIFAKREIAVPRFLILNLLPGQEIVDFFALPGELDSLLPKLFCLFFQNFRATTGNQA